MGALPLGDLTTAASLIRANADYRAALGDAFEALWFNPWIEGHLIAEPGLAFTWLRSPLPLAAAPTREAWRETRGGLWLVDLVATPRTGVRAARRMRHLLAERNIASEGEAVYFYRYRAGRYGYIIARSASQ